MTPSRRGELHRPRLPDRSTEGARSALQAEGFDAARVELVLGLLDGNRTLRDLLGTLVVEGFSAGEALRVVDWIEQSGLAEEDPSSELAQLTQPERERF